MEKRKNGKMRSTHVMPNIDGLKTWSGGGTCAWYIHAGSSWKISIADSTIVMMA